MASGAGSSVTEHHEAESHQVKGRREPKERMKGFELVQATFVEWKS